MPFRIRVSIAFTSVPARLQSGDHPCDARAVKRARRVAAAVAILGAMQLVTCERTNPPVTGKLEAPPEIAGLLERACYDCHSNQTVWPWYTRVAPFSWLIHRDVVEGRRHLNFSEWSALPADKQARRKKAAAREVDKGTMPLWFYLPLHPAARLTDADRAALARWADGS
jgi:Haem-binding domain